MADNRKVNKLPRSLLAQMTNNNQQAIKAFENLEEIATVANPREVAELIKQIGEALEQIEQAITLATQSAAIVNQAIADNKAPLQAVSVPPEPYISLQAINLPLEQSDHLQAVSMSFDCQSQLNPVQGDI